MERKAVFKILLFTLMAFALSPLASGQQLNSNNFVNPTPGNLARQPNSDFDTNILKPKTLLLDSLSSDTVSDLNILKISQSQKTEKPKDLLLTGESWGFLHVATDPRAFGDLMSVEGEMAYSPVDEFDIEQGFREYKPQMFTLISKGAWAGFEYGAKYVQVEDGFDRVPGTALNSNQEGKEIWIDRNLNVLKFKTFISDYWDNVNFNSNRPKARKTQAGAALDIAFPYWPVLSLSYSRGSSLIATRRDGSVSKNESIQTLNSSLYYLISKWQLSINSSYSMGKDKNQTDMNSRILLSEIRGSYTPIKSISISPSIGFTKEEYKWLGAELDYMTPATSLAINYSPLNKAFNLKAYGHYSRYTSNDGFTDANTFNGLTEFAWKLGKTPIGDQTVSLEFGYYNYLNSAFSKSSYQEYSAFLAYKIASF
ncbi:MAG: hypothetical protein WBD99_09825 [Thermodesulfobacteriota bacterium]